MICKLSRCMAFLPSMYTALIVAFPAQSATVTVEVQQLHMVKSMCTYITDYAENIPHSHSLNRGELVVVIWIYSTLQAVCSLSVLCVQQIISLNISTRINHTE
jgi:hypothetical protein